MSDDTSQDQRVQSLRDEFDASFAAAPREPRRDLVALLAIRVGAEPMAVRVLETAGLMPMKKIVRVPSRRPELLGVAGLRGSVIPIYSLAHLLGRAHAVEPPRWMFLAGGNERVGLAFAALEGHAVVPVADLHEVARSAAGREHVTEIVQLGRHARPVLSIPSLVRVITER